MAARRKTAAPAPAVAWSTLATVEPGHWALLADGRECLVASTIGGTPLVLFADDEPRTGPTPMPRDTPVRSTRAPDLAPVDRTAVVDPLSRAAAADTDLFHGEDA